MERAPKEGEKGWWHSCHISRRNHVLTGSECPRCGQKKPGTEGPDAHTPKDEHEYVSMPTVYECSSCGKRHGSAAIESAQRGLFRFRKNDSVMVGCPNCGAQGVVSVVVMGRCVGVWNLKGDVIKKFSIDEKLRENVTAYLKEMNFLVNNADSFTYLDEFKIV